MKISIGININDSSFPWTDVILSGKKRIETRNTPTLDPYLGKRVGIIRTGVGKAILVGFVDIVGKKVYSSVEEFRKDEYLHLVKIDSPFDFKGSKIGYVLQNPEKLSTPTAVETRGIVSRKINVEQEQ